MSPQRAHLVSGRRKSDGIEFDPMADISKMRVWARYLREQAKSFRAMGNKAHHDEKLHDEFFDLAQICEAIADRIDANIRKGIHKPGKPAEGGRIN